jgi:hypothetical protein
MAILDLVHASSARGALLQSRRATPRHQLSPTAVAWLLRITTIVLLLVATLIGLQLALSAPTVSPVAMIGQEQEADGHT